MTDTTTKLVPSFVPSAAHTRLTIERVIGEAQQALDTHLSGDLHASVQHLMHAQGWLTAATSLVVTESSARLQQIDDVLRDFPLINPANGVIPEGDFTEHKISAMELRKLQRLLVRSTSKGGAS